MWAVQQCRFHTGRCFMQTQQNKDGDAVLGATESKANTDQDTKHTLEPSSGLTPEYHCST